MIDRTEKECCISSGSDSGEETQPIARGRIAGHVAVNAVLFVAIVVLLLPYPRSGYRVDPRLFATENSEFADLDGVSIHYRRWESDAPDREPAAVLIHTFGDQLITFRPLIPHLLENRDVIAYDQAGSGLSERATAPYRDRNPYTLEARVQRLRELVLTVDEEPVALIAHGYGAAIAMQFALAYPDSVAGLVLISPLVFEAPFPLISSARLPSPAWRAVAHAVSFGVGPHPVEQRRAASPEEHDRLNATVEQLYARLTRIRDWERSIVEQLRIVEPFGPLDQLPSITHPTLVLAGHHDTVAAPELSLRLADQLPNSQVHVLPDCGHYLHEECEAHAVDHILDHLERIATRRMSN